MLPTTFTNFITMPTLNEQIMNDLKEAMKQKDQSAMTTLRALKSAIKYAAIEKVGADGELPEADAIAVSVVEAEAETVADGDVEADTEGVLDGDAEPDGAAVSAAE